MDSSWNRTEKKTNKIGSPCQIIYNNANEFFRRTHVKRKERTKLPTIKNLAVHLILIRRFDTFNSLNVSRLNN